MRFKNEKHGVGKYKVIHIDFSPENPFAWKSLQMSWASLQFQNRLYGTVLPSLILLNDLQKFPMVLRPRHLYPVYISVFSFECQQVLSIIVDQ